jgi:Flp pilus assembly pilin Flp
MRSTSRLARMRDRLSPEDGQTMAEYGVLLGTVVIGCLLTFGMLTGGIVSLVDSVVSLLP